MLQRLALTIALWMPISAFAADILELNTSARPLGSPNFTNVVSILTNGGHTITTGTLAELPNSDLLWISEPEAGFSAADITDVQNFVTGGGYVLIISDSSCVGCPEINTLLGGIGSSITIGGAAGSPAPLASAFFTTSPRDIAGQSLNLTPGTQAVSGNPLSGSIAAYEELGSGLVVVFGDVFDFNSLIGTDDSSVNAQLVLNIADNAQGAAPPPAPSAAAPIPVDSPLALALLISLLLGIGMLGARRIA